LEGLGDAGEGFLSSSGSSSSSSRRAIEEDDNDTDNNNDNNNDIDEADDNHCREVQTAYSPRALETFFVLVAVLVPAVSVARPFLNKCWQ